MILLWAAVRVRARVRVGMLRCWPTHRALAECPEGLDAARHAVAARHRGVIEPPLRHRAHGVLGAVAE